MIKKINIFLVLLLLLISIGAVSAADEGNVTDIISSEAIQDTMEVSVDENIDYGSYDSDDVVAIDDESSEISAAPHTITKDNYGLYFDSKTGELKSTSNVKSGDTIELSGDFSNKNFIFNQTVNIVGTSSNSLSESKVILLKGASGSTITNLTIINKKDMSYGIFLNSTTDCTISNCNINNTGKSSYCICLGNGANYNNITSNNLETYGVTYGHNQRSTPPLVVSGSHHNIISDNKIKVDDANGIYLSSYAGGPLIGGESNFNVIRNNIINYKVLPTSWSWGIQVMGSNNEINNNTVNGAYRGISTTQFNNRITNNTINNLTGADYNNPKVEIGGEYGIVASYKSYVAGNKINNAKIISTGAGIYATDGSTVENNYVNVTSKGKGIDADGSNVIVANNNVFTESGSGVYQKAEVYGLIVKNNKITSVSGVGILIEKLSSKRMPRNVNILNNTIITKNAYAIDVSGVKKGTANIDQNNVGSASIMDADGIYDASKPTYIYNGDTHNITSNNLSYYINDNGGLTPKVKDGDILNFIGTFEDQVIYITKGVKITGNNAIFKNSTFKVTSGNVLIENLTIINNKANRVNAWGIYVNQASGVKIINNKISVNDSKASYAIYVLESTYIEVSNNELSSEGDYLTFTLLAYACEDCSFTNNIIHTNGTGTIYNFKTERCIDGGEVCIDGKTYCVDGNELYINGVKQQLDENNSVCIDGKTYCVDGNEICIDGKTYCLDCNEVIINGTSVCIDGNNVYIDGNKYCLDCNELTINGVTYCIDGNAVCVDGKEVCVDGNEGTINGRSVRLNGNNLTIDGVTYCIDGNENSVCIDGVTYCVDGNEICIDGKVYCLDCNEIQINGKSVCIDGNEVFIDGNKYCLDCNELTIDGVTYCIDGNEVCVDGVTYCTDGNEATIYGRSVSLNGTNLTIDGVIYCIDGNEKSVCIDGVTYCFDGNEVTVDGNSTYCFDGNEYKSTGAHVVSEIYQTYGILLLYSSNNVINKNKVNVTSKVSEIYLNTSSTNSIVGIDLYFNSHNNTFSDNTVSVHGKDNYIYGMGVLGYTTGHSASEGQGATNNSFIHNTITLDGVYCVEGIIIGDESEGTIIKDNVLNITSDAVVYGIYLEMSQKSTVDNNKLTLNSDSSIYGIQGFSSSDNIITNNNVNANAKAVYGLVFSNGNHNVIVDNNIAANGNSENITGRIKDAIKPGNAGIYLCANSTYNNIENNNITSKIGFAILVDDAAINNTIVNNYLKSEKGNANGAISNSKGNIVSENYINIAKEKETPTFVHVTYFGPGDISITFDNNDVDEAIVKFYDNSNNLIGQSNVSNCVASINYAFDESYIAGAQYKFSAELLKEGYKVLNYTINVIVDKGNITINAHDVSIPQGSTGNIVVTLSDEFGNPIKGALVNFYRDSLRKFIGKDTSDKNGVVTFSYDVPASLEEGDHEIVAKVSGVDNYKDAETTFNLKVTSALPPVATILTASAAKITTTYKTSKNLVVTLVDVNGKAIANADITVVLNKVSKTIKTDENGKASFAIPTNLAPNTYTAKISYAGDFSHVKSSASTTVVVNKAASKITAAKKTFKAKTKTKKYTITLKSGKTALKKVKVTLKVKGKTYTAKTNNKGKATFKITKLTKKGKYTATIKSSATKYYKAAKKSVKITVKK